MTVLANIAVPMITMVAPIFALGFAPIVLIESAWFNYRQPALNFNTAVKPVLIANLCSTAFGVPVTLFASPNDALALFIPFLLASVLIEYKVMKHLLRSFEVQKLGTTVWIANVLSYTLIAGLWIVMLLV